MQGVPWGIESGLALLVVQLAAWVTVASFVWLAVDTLGRGRGWYSALFLLLMVDVAAEQFLPGRYVPWMEAVLHVGIAFVAGRLAFGRMLFRLVQRSRFRYAAKAQARAQARAAAEHAARSENREWAAPPGTDSAHVRNVTR